MKNAYHVLLTLLFISFSGISAQQAGDDMLYTNQGYPYESLVKRSESIKIFYTKNKESTRCRVEVDVKGKIWRSSQQSISNKAFNATPLAACLARSDAKQLLAKTFTD